MDMWGWTSRGDISLGGGGLVSTVVVAPHPGNIVSVRYSGQDCRRCLYCRPQRYRPMYYTRLEVPLVFP